MTSKSLRRAGTVSIACEGTKARAHPSPERQWLSHVIRVTAIIAIGAVLVRLAYACFMQGSFPFDIVYESPNLATIRLLQAGHPVYSPATYDRPPFVITIYPPLYHALIAALPQSASNPFLTGRIVAACSMLGLTGLFFLIGDPPRTRWWPSLAAGLFFGVRPIVSNTAFLRHDPLALFFAAAATLVISKKLSMRTVVFAALLASAAALTKQSFLTCGFACTVFLLAHDPRKGAVFIATLSSLVATGFAASALLLGTWEGVWFSWLVAPRNPLVPAHLVNNALALLQQPTFVVLAALALGSLGMRISKRGCAVLRESTFAIYLLVAVPAAIITSSKDGAAVNSYFEFIVAAILWTIHDCRDLPGRGSHDWRVLAGVGVACLAMITELLLATPTDYCMVGPRRQMAVNFHLQLAARQLQGVPIDRGKVLNLTEDGWATFTIGNTAHVNDPLLYTILYENNLLSVEPLCAAIRRREYDLILLPKGDPPKWLDRVPWGQVLDAVAESYFRRSVPDRAEEAAGVLAYLIPKR